MIYLLIVLAPFITPWSHALSFLPKNSKWRSHTNFDCKWQTPKAFGLFSSSECFRFKALESDTSHLVTQDRQVVTEIGGELKSAFISYAMSTILSRALPDARDGLKPVHRRVLYAMHNLGLGPDATYRKCARIVGEVLGKFHPHGDTSVYDALVRMAQDFVMLHPLIKGHGNFGSVDDDPPAAMRYTEAKLSTISQEALMEDLREGTVDFAPNFDGSEEEPVVLPSSLPMLLINGATGIAVGMATNIPPHCLSEVVDGLVALVRNPNLSDDELLQLIPAPDFPTGGQILGIEGARSLYLTGQGSITVRATFHMETLSSSGRTVGKANQTTSLSTGKLRPAIVVTELPYMTNKASLLEKMADAVNDKRLEGISDIRDESDRDGIRIVIELKRDARADVVVNNLFEKTALQTSFSGNLLALVDEGMQPKRLTLREALQEFIRFRFDTLRRRATHQLQRLETREHVVEGLERALANIDGIITKMKESKDGPTAKAALMDSFGFSDSQADAILALTLRRLTGLEAEKLHSERRELTERIVSLKALLNDDALVYDQLVQEALLLRQRHGGGRRSTVVKEVENVRLQRQDLIPNTRCVVLVTHSGYVKRLSLEDFDPQSRGGRGRQGTKLSSFDDGIAHLFTCMVHDQILFVSDGGFAYLVPAHSLPLASRTSKGSPLPQLISISRDERITSAMPIANTGSSKTEDQFLLCLTAEGWLKKTPMLAFAKPRKSGLRLISLKDGDSLRWARQCGPHDEVLIATSLGYAGRFSVDSLRTAGRNSKGLRSLRLRTNDTVADMDILASDAAPLNNELTKVRSLLAVTRKGLGKRLTIEEFRPLHRGCRGVIATKFRKASDDKLLALRVCSDNDEVVVSTKNGVIIRQRVSRIPPQSRQGTGVKLQEISAGDAVAMVDIVPPPANN